MDRSIALQPRPVSGRVQAATSATTVADVLRAGIVTITVVLVLVGLTVGVMTYGFGMENRGRWDLISERTVPAAWSSILFLMAAGLMLAAAGRERGSGSRVWRWWTTLAVVALAAAVDEFFAFHERTIEPIRDALGVGGLLLYAWVIPGILGMAALAVIFARFVAQLDAPVRHRLITGVALLVTGAIGMEMIGGWWAQKIGTDVGWMLLFVTEESLEFAGAVAIVFAVLRHHELRGARWLGRPLTIRP